MNPFRFKSSVESVQLTGVKAATLAELDAGLRQVDATSIYHHTHRFYRSHSFLGPADRSDFALWVGENLKEAEVAEKMGALDLRDYGTIQDLRDALLETLESLREDPSRWERRVPPGLEFHFCRSISLILPTRYEARNLEEFLQGLERVDTSSIYFHLIESPLHFHGAARDFNNDFSQWLFEAGYPDQAGAMAILDPYRSDLEALRQDLLSLFHRDFLKASLQRVLDRAGRLSSGEAAAHWLRRFRKES